MIELGLSRMSRLVGDSVLPWRALHVAGTNGKGSVCAYASSMLQAAGVPYGRFTSPHLIDKWDCINVNGNIVDESLFRQMQDRVQWKNEKDHIKASEFELLTATAFEIFSEEKVNVGVIEVGLGGRLDATNVLKDPLVTVITKIGKDHEAFLGNTLEAIARQKAGIMKPDVPCVVDGTNNEEVLDEIRRYGQEIQCGPIIQIPQQTQEAEKLLWSVLQPSLYEEHQKTNIAIALESVRFILDQIELSVDPVQLIMAVKDTAWPGRLHHMSVGSLTGREADVLLDGAHNMQSATVLGSYVERKIRIRGRPVTWVIAVSQGKDVEEMLHLLLRPGDNLFSVEFGPVDGMPWVQATPSDEVLRKANDVTELGTSSAVSESVTVALKSATYASDGGPLVIAGSLYLVSDVFRLIRNAPGL